jgi:hypothetical protein
MNGLRIVSGIWTFLIAIILGIAGGTIAFVISETLWIALAVLALVLVLTVAVTQWI